MDSPEQTNETNQAPATDSLGRTEIQVLKERAATLGIQHSPNIGVDTLKQKIADHLEGKPKEQPKAPEAAAPVPTGKETKQQKRARMQKEAMRLVRVRIYNMNPTKSDLQGEIVSVGNGIIGTVRKFIPFGEATDGGYHVPAILLKELRSRKFQQINTRKVRGEIKVDTRLVPEYNIEVLPPLTRTEIKQLADQQAAAERLGA